MHARYFVLVVTISLPAYHYVARLHFDVRRRRAQVCCARMGGRHRLDSGPTDGRARTHVAAAVNRGATRNEITIYLP